MSGKFYIEAACNQRNFGNERICGDVFLSRKVKEENRTIVILSDGMGHGVKANVLATLTATMAVNFTIEHKAVEKIAEIIMNTLPVCSERQMSYSTFTIVDIEHDGLINILEFDNPQTIILRDNKPFDPAWETLVLDSERKMQARRLFPASLNPGKRTESSSAAMASPNRVWERTSIPWDGEETICRSMPLNWFRTVPRYRPPSWP